MTASDFLRYAKGLDCHYFLFLVQHLQNPLSSAWKDSNPLQSKLSMQAGKEMDMYVWRAARIIVFESVLGKSRFEGFCSMTRTKQDKVWNEFCLMLQEQY